MCSDSKNVVLYKKNKTYNVENENKKDEKKEKEKKKKTQV